MANTDKAWTEAQIDRHLHLWEHRHGPDSPEAGIVRQLRAERDKARSDWQPIETAPLDGTKFDVLCAHENVPFPVRFTDVQMRGDKSGLGFVIHSRKKVEWHYLDARGDDPVFPAWTPTHWMPLPTLPTKQEALHE